MLYLLEELRKCRNYLIKNCKHINTGRSRLFILISVVIGILLTAGGCLVAPKSIGGRICIGVGLFIVFINMIQLIYRKYI